MQESDASPKPVFFFPPWMRIGMACLMFLVSVVSMWNGFLRFEWIPWFCFGLFYLLYTSRQKDEAFATYAKKPRVVASLGSLIVGILGFSHHLLTLFTQAD